MFFATLGVAGGWTTLILAGFYNWASSIYGYNRDAWMTDVQLKQQFEYQKDNMQIATHSMSREEVRDRTQAAITKLSNYILVTTLILSLSAEILVEGQVPDCTVDYILNVYMLCLGTSVLYLVLSILFGIVAINQIYETSAEILTVRKPPEWERIHTEMQQRSAKNMVDHFERKPWKQIFVPPIIRRYTMVSDEDELQRQYSSEEAKPRDGTILQDIREEYFRAFMERSKAWDPLTSQSFVCLALGVKNLLDVYGYLCMAMLYSKYGNAWAFWAVQILFTCLNVLLMHFLFQTRGEKRWRWMSRTIIVASGPMFCAIAATTPFVYVDCWCVPLCYVSHFLLMMLFSSSVNTRRSCTFEEQQEEFYVGELVEFRDRLGWKKARVTSIDPLEVAGAARDEVRHLDTEVSDAQALEIRQLRSESEELLHFEATGEECWGSDVQHQIHQIDMAGCVKHMRELASVVCSSQDSESQPQVSPRSDNSFSFNQGENGRFKRESQYLLRKETTHTKEVVTLMILIARTVMQCLWLISVLWAVTKAFSRQGFMNAEAVIHLSGPPLAHSELVQTKWPSPYFSPHALVCPEKGEAFLADDFRVFKLSRSGTITTFPCSVNGTIADISADCDGDTCWPMVLLRSMPPVVLECSTGKEYPLLQSEWPAEQFAVVNAYTLVAAHNGEIIEYRWNPRYHGWQPHWIVANIGRETLQALDVTSDHQRMLIFRRQGVVQLQDLKTGKQCGTWQTPPAMLGAGCSEEGGKVLKLLVRINDPELGPQVRLMRSTLDGPQTCDQANLNAAAFRKRSSSGGTFHDNNRWFD